MDATKPYEFIGFGAMDAAKPYEFIGFGAMDAAKPYEVRVSRPCLHKSIERSPVGGIIFPFGHDFGDLQTWPDERLGLYPWMSPNPIYL